MSEIRDELNPARRDGPHRWVVCVLVMGCYLSLRGYHSLDGDQAYRLPLLLHRQDPALYAGDPFVSAFDAFNPHRGSLLVLEGVTGLLGLSAGLAALFAITFAATFWGIDRLARGIWPEMGKAVGWLAVILVLLTKAGNIGTNHLFEGMVLDRLMGFALGWIALAAVVTRPERGWRIAALALGGATLIHPSLGLQLALAQMASWGVWALFGRRTGVSWKCAVAAVFSLGLAVIPGLFMNLGRGETLLNGLPIEDFRVLSVELQGPQHMLPHLWRMPQWLAWGCFFILAAPALALRSPQEARTGKRWPEARLRLVLVLGVVLAGLGGAWFGIEVLHHLRLTVFQPFRMATVARGLALLLVAGRMVALWRRGGWLDRTRCFLMAFGLTGDWLLVVVTAAEIAATLLDSLGERFGPVSFGRLKVLVFAGLLAYGTYFLSRHDTESGHVPLLAALILSLAFVAVERRGLGFKTRREGFWTARRLRWALGAAWALPIAALLAGLFPGDHAAVRRLVAHCRFNAVPVDDVERLAVWCREHTSATARFIGPPGPKTFRLWSRRSLAFNRAASPYHAAGLADWFARYQAHVDDHSPPAEFVRAYLAGRHRLEGRYDALSPEKKAALALRQGADHVIALADGDVRGGPLERLHVEGRYAVYRVRPELVANRQR